MEKRRSQLDCSLSSNDTTQYYSFEDNSIYEDQISYKKPHLGLGRKGGFGYFTTSTPALPTIGRSFAKRKLRDNLSITNITTDFSMIHLTRKDKSMKKLSTSVPTNNSEVNALLVDKAQQSLIVLKRDTSLILSQKITSPETIKEMDLLLDQMLSSPKTKKFKPSKRNIRF